MQRQAKKLVLTWSKHLHCFVSGHKGVSAKQCKEPAQPCCPYGGELALHLLAGAYVQEQWIGLEWVPA